MFGFWKGMAWQIASLASLVVSYFAALRFSAQLAPMFGDTAPFNRFVAMLVIYIVTSFVIWTLFRLVSGAIDKVKLESFDSQMGAMIGAGQGRAVVRRDHVLRRDAVAAGRRARRSSTRRAAGTSSPCSTNRTRCSRPRFIRSSIRIVNKVEQRLNPNFQPHGQRPARLVAEPGAVASAGAASRSTGRSCRSCRKSIGRNRRQPTAQPQHGRQPQQSAWPTSIPTAVAAAAATVDAATQPNPYAVPREPNPFPAGSYSAEVPGGRDY